ncbi:Tetratricopeptide repeat-domain-containing protein [Chaetomium strumarium]|uniref:Tetratricopeptide repeat-domain-containing protein n=1 Tax=Chaetomium strumarium TaxID=1170767 RepID=A0AAJ0GRL3_9PEZI|nr:Tetratricopeptide repeat-domain-containing protein [Chaetomium strumarium]
MNNLASTYQKQGRWEEAEKLFLQVMETFEAKLGVDHPHTLTIMNNLAFTWKGQGRHPDALALMEKCTKARQRVLGPDHPTARSSLATVAKWRT